MATVDDRLVTLTASLGAEVIAHFALDAAAPETPVPAAATDSGALLTARLSPRRSGA